MAKEVAISKRITISKAQQNMILAVAATGLVVGVKAWNVGFQLVKCCLCMCGDYDVFCFDD